MTRVSSPRHLQVIYCVRVPTRMRILVIEDEPRILAFLSRGLQAEGFVVDGAGDGPAGLAHAVAGRYDLVVLDLLLPKLGGLEVLRHLQQQRPEVPVVVVSA